MRSLTLLLMALVTAACAAQQAAPRGGTAVMEGRVWFADGEVALPDGAVATVSLLDTSLQDVAATVIGRHALAVASLPFDFRIEYDPSQIEDRNEYSLQARIELDGRLLYINDTVHTVLTGGSPAQSDIEVIRIAPAETGESSASITVRVSVADGVEIPLGSEVTATLVNLHRPTEVIDERAIPAVAFPVELSLRYDARGLDSTYAYEVHVAIADGGRVLFYGEPRLRFDPSAPPAQPLSAELRPAGSDGWPSDR